MNLEPIKNRAIQVIAEFTTLLTYSEELDEKQKHLDRQHVIHLQEKNAYTKNTAQLKLDQQKLDTEEQRILEQKKKVETAIEIMDRQKRDYATKIAEMRTVQASIDKKLESAEGIDEKEKELNEVEAQIAEKSEKVARREGLVAKEKEILRDRKLHLDELQKKLDAKIIKVNKILA